MNENGDPTLPHGVKPSKVVSKDLIRPILTRAEVRDGNLYATDSYCAIKLPVGLADGQIPRGVLEAAEKKGSVVSEQGEVVRVELADGVAVEGRADAPGDFPDMEKIIGDEPEETFQVALNPKLLLKVALGLGTEGVVLTFDRKALKGKTEYRKPIRVRSLNDAEEGVGVLMPLRLSV